MAHAGEDAELRTLADPLLLERSIEHGRIFVTRNCRDYVPLVRRLARDGREFPGVLFVPSSIRHADAGGLVRALRRWIADAPPGANPVASSSGWLSR